MRAALPIAMLAILMAALVLAIPERHRSCVIEAHADGLTCRVTP